MKNNITERESKPLKLNLALKNVLIQNYHLVSDFIRKINIGTFNQQSVCPCKDTRLSSVSYLQNTLNFNFRSRFCFAKMKFIDQNQSTKLFQSIQDISSSGYGQLGIFLRMRGDAFRMC